MRPDPDYRALIVACFCAGFLLGALTALVIT